jgi:hypothetical protein
MKGQAGTLILPPLHGRTAFCFVRFQDICQWIVNIHRSHRFPLEFVAFVQDAGKGISSKDSLNSRRAAKHAVWTIALPIRPTVQPFLSSASLASLPR